MMQRYRFVGSYTEMGDRVFSRLGQVADWDEEVYRHLVVRAPFIPDPDFQRIEFTQDELSRYADYANRALAPDSFTAKVKQAIMVLVDIREKLESREVHEELQTAEEPGAAEDLNPEESEGQHSPTSEDSSPEKFVHEEDQPEPDSVVELNSNQHAVVPAPVEVQHELKYI